MKNLLLLIFIAFSSESFAQVIPFGTIIKGKRLPTISTSFVENLDYSLNYFTLIGNIKINDSKLPIIESGFVILNISNPSIPDVTNARKIISNSGNANFLAVTSNLSSNTTFKYRAYAKNSKNQFSYSSLTYFFMRLNPCETSPTPCKNGGACTYDFENLILFCNCTPGNCGDCCAQATDPNDPFCVSGINFCNSYFQQ